MSIDSINQSAESSYISKHTIEQSLVEKKTSKPEFQRMVNDVVEISDEAKAAHAASSNSNPRGSLLTAWLNSTSGKADLSNAPTSPPEGAKLNMNGYSSIDEMMNAAVKAAFGADDWRAHSVEMKLKSEYGAAKGEFDRGNYKELVLLHEKLTFEAGGLLNGMSYEPDDLSKPIRTTDGRIHPKSVEIRSFLEAHKSEFDQMDQIRNRQFMSFDEWKIQQEA